MTKKLAGHIKIYRNRNTYNGYYGYNGILPMDTAGYYSIGNICNQGLNGLQSDDSKTVNNTTTDAIFVMYILPKYVLSVQYNINNYTISSIAISRKAVEGWKK